MHEYGDRWARLDLEFSKISAQLRRAECVFGFADRKEMVSFAAILEQNMPSISQRAAVRYSIHVQDNDRRYHPGWWYRASLDSEELIGTPFVRLHYLRVY